VDAANTFPLQASSGLDAGSLFGSDLGDRRLIWQRYHSTLCVVADVTGGRVTQVREYFDSVAAAPLVAALSRG
jgi:hypothetical protein